LDSICLSIIKKNACAEGALIVYEDEASFRQSPTLHQTWAPLNSQPSIPTKGARNTQKVLGAVALHTAKFVYRIQEEYFNHETYISFLQDCVLQKLYKRNHRIFLIQDNASYHKKPETYEWFKENRDRMEVFCLPRYQPQLNAIERLWHHTRMKSTHNRFHETVDSLLKSLTGTFGEIQNNPDVVKVYLQAYF